MKKQISVYSPSSQMDDTFFDMTHFVRDVPVPEHSHDCIEITIILNGTAIHTANGCEHQLRRGDGFIILPEGVHGMEECRGLDHFNISCSPNILHQVGITSSFMHGMRELFFSPEKHNTFHFGTREFNDAKLLIETMFTIYQRDREKEKGNLRAYFAMMLCLMAQSYSLNHHWSSTAGRLENVLQYIDEHFREPITLRQLAEMASLSSSQLVRQFRREFDVTPIGYVIEQRLNEAWRLLQMTNYSISEIAYFCGFCDSNYMSCLFRKHYNLTPRQVRDKKRNSLPK